jgi:hypothetical protein
MSLSKRSSLFGSTNSDEDKKGFMAVVSADMTITARLNLVASLAENCYNAFSQHCCDSGFTHFDNHSIFTEKSEKQLSFVFSVLYIIISLATAATVFNYIVVVYSIPLCIIYFRLK